MGIGLSEVKYLDAAVHIFYVIQNLYVCLLTFSMFRARHVALSGKIIRGSVDHPLHNSDWHMDGCASKPKHSFSPALAP